jgi:dipeptidase E
MPPPTAGSSANLVGLITGVCEREGVRLYLSSFRMGRCPNRLRDLVRGDRRAAVIANAMDGQPTHQRLEGVDRELTALSELGLRPEHLDLRDYFDRDDIRAALEKYDLVWLRGGNVFMLRYALARSRADEAIVERLAADSVCYGGYSAGPCVLSRSIAEFAEVDDRSVVASTYGDRAPERGLGILDWVFVPHVDTSDHPETEACGRVAARYATAGMPLRTLRDGEVLVIDGQTEALCT